ncbi:hypothetical protein [Limnofasciculus baicalensis]|uniref:Uncharacterized protein n=1 Tax=Limnofasciculus baicalensis BBK-W-15 TaxID=2699891 RepID=A0AAE3GRF2_9CYAN|nr:hypothetical protein [Limnofasciculus baicalensis]MCP2729340.1 hypothetical protein [Limnofasciculus baicalensis BBK-W-15]
MDDLKNTSFESTTIENKAIQPRLLLQALAFTVILAFCVDNRSPNKRMPIFQAETPFSEVVGNAVLEKAAEEAKLPISDLHLIDIQQKTWSNQCLDLGKPGVSCTKMPIPGWHVAVASREQRWIYRTDTSGNAIELERSMRE